MSYLNANIPPIYCKIRKEYLYDLREHQGETEDCVVFGLGSISGRALLFHCLLTNGAVYWRLPISAFIQRGSGSTLHKREMEHQDLNDLQLWNSFSYYPSITVFDFLKGQRCKYFSKTKNKLYHGEYLFTVDWAHPESNILDTEHSEIPDQHKCGHVLALDNGNYAIMPNNRILWDIPSFTTSSSVPDYKVQTTVWNVENKGLVTDDTDKFFYDIIDKEKINE
jgi:hypothetical protein